MKTFCSLAIGVIFASAALAQSSDRPKQSIGAAANSFAFQIIGKTATSSDENYLLSPFSVSCALSLLIPGTKGGEQNKLLSIIAPGFSAQQAMFGYGALSNQMVKSHQMSVANSAWADSRMKLSAGYAKAIKGPLGAQVSSFQHNQGSLKKINSWVSAKTKQRIPKILDQIKDADRLFLINAIAFDGKWQEQFDPARTAQQTFHAAGGRDEQVQMMHMKRKVAYFKNGTLRAIRLNYQGGEYSMLLMLPEFNDDVSETFRGLNAKSLDKILSGASSSDSVNIALPKFKFSDSFQLKDALSAVGLGSFFNHADFSKISPSLADGKIDRVIHKTFVELDEKGTKAAAATSIGIQPTMVRVDQPEFIADKPFAFYILHNKTKTIVFAGVVNKV